MFLTLETILLRFCSNMLGRWCGGCVSRLGWARHPKHVYTLPLQAPNCPYERVYVLPLTSISMSKGTGVVTR